MFSYWIIVFESLFSSSQGNVRGCTLSTTTWCLYQVGDGFITTSCFNSHCHNLLLLCPVLSGCPLRQHIRSISVPQNNCVLCLAQESLSNSFILVAVTQEGHIWLYGLSLYWRNAVMLLFVSIAKGSVFHIEIRCASYHLKPNCLQLDVPTSSPFLILRVELQSVRSAFGFTFSSLHLGILNLCSLLLFPWTLSTLLSPGLIWYSINWLHQKVIMAHIIVIITLLFLPLSTSNLSTCENCFTRSKIVKNI